MLVTTMNASDTVRPFAAVGFSQGLRAEVAEDGISVTTVVPGLMNTGSFLHAEFGGDREGEFRWFALGTNNITPAGGAAVIAGSGGVRIYARDASGRVHEKRLTSSGTCAAGSCTWGTWTALPVRATNDDIAATYAGSQRVVAVRGTDDRLYAIEPATLTRSPRSQPETQQRGAEQDRPCRSLPGK